MERMERTILHCDCNAYFASVECLARPELALVPMAVSGDPKSRHGIILAKNELAKAFGVRTAEPIWQAKKKCPNLVLVIPHHSKYGEYSQRINAIYGQYTDLVEPFGVDESWLDVTGSLHLFGDGRTIADQLRARIRETLGLTISVGVSFNKTFAKLGSDYKKPDATTVITPENFKSIVWPLPAGDLLFVGPATARTLLAAGIETIGDIARAGESVMRGLLGRCGEAVWARAAGLDDGAVRPMGERDPAKSVGNGFTFARDLAGEADVRAALTMLCDEVGTRLRKQGVFGTTLQLAIRDPSFKTISRQQRLPEPTNATRELLLASYALFTRVWPDGAPIRMLTVTVASLTGEGRRQLRLFDDGAAEHERNARLDAAVDAIRSRYGRDAIQYGGALETDLVYHSGKLEPEIVGA